MEFEDYLKKLDPEMKDPFEVLQPFLMRIHEDVQSGRQMMEDMRKQSEESALPDTVEIKVVVGPNVNGFDVPIYLYIPRNKTPNMPGIFWIHGGGFTLGSAAEHQRCTALVDQLGCVIASVEYRLAPEHPFPIPIDDCYASLLWFFESAEELGIDRTRIAIAGASAGGGLAAGTMLMARDKGEVAPCFQLLIYPCLDNRHTTSSSIELADPRMIWDRSASLKGWEAYLGGASGKDVSHYAAPALVKSVKSLPPTYIMVGELDLMRDENIEYASRLMKENIPTELHVYAGAPHGFDGLMAEASVSKRAQAEVVEALKKALHGSI